MAFAKKLKEGGELTVSGKKMVELNEAAARGDLDEVKRLAEKEGRADIEDQYHETALHRAAWGGSLEVARFLTLEMDADVNAATPFGKTPLHRAAVQGHLKIVELLIKCGASVEKENGDGETPLHWAAKKGRLNVVEFLLDRGADAQKKNRRGKTPADLARKNGFLLVAACMEVNDKSNGKIRLPDTA